MEANPLFRKVVEGYKSHLSEDLSKHKSFNAYCRENKVSPGSVSQWMYRHGLDIGSLRCEALLERYGTSKEDVLSIYTEEKKRYAAEITEKNSAKNIPLDRRIKGVEITFPDGIVITIRETTPVALTTFIKLHTKLMEENYVRVK